MPTVNASANGAMHVRVGGLLDEQIAHKVLPSLGLHQVNGDKRMLSLRRNPGAGLTPGIVPTTHRHAAGDDLRSIRRWHSIGR
jgi:hypothetical protein